jgi:hypothetical protein
MPTKAANRLFSIGNLAFDKNFLVFSGGKYDRISETTKIITANSNRILIVS